jgi:hypothetical protein
VSDTKRKSNMNWHVSNQTGRFTLVIGSRCRDFVLSQVSANENPNASNPRLSSFPIVFWFIIDIDYFMIEFKLQWINVRSRLIRTGAVMSDMKDLGALASWRFQKEDVPQPLDPAAEKSQA